jgi:formate hydrogenlyase transcriptional activator
MSEPPIILVSQKIILSVSVPVTGADWDSYMPFLHADDREETRRVWSDCLRTGCAGEVCFRIRNAEGGYRWFLSRVEPVTAANGTLLYWIGINLDIEEREQAEFYLAEGQRLAHMGSWAFTPCRVRVLVFGVV